MRIADEDLKYLGFIKPSLMLKYLNGGRYNSKNRILAWYRTKGRNGLLRIVQREGTWLIWSYPPVHQLKRRYSNA